MIKTATSHRNSYGGSSTPCTAPAGAWYADCITNSRSHWYCGAVNWLQCSQPMVGAGDQSKKALAPITNALDLGNAVNTNLSSLQDSLTSLGSLMKYAIIAISILVLVTVIRR